MVSFTKTLTLLFTKNVSVQINIYTLHQKYFEITYKNQNCNIFPSLADPNQVKVQKLMLNISVENNFFLYYSKVKIKRQSKRKQKQNIELKKENTKAKAFTKMNY